MTDHPHDLLAEYADGALGAEARARVAAHVAACPDCRRDLELARAGRQALRTLTEVPPPEGLTLGVLREARRRRRAPGLAWKVGAAAAAAAVIAALVVVAVRPDGALLGSGAGDEGAPEARAPAPQQEEQGGEGAREAAPGAAEDAGARTERLAGAPAPRYVETQRDHDPESLARLAQRLRAEARASLEAGFPEPATEFYAGFDLDQVPAQARRAGACVLRELPPERPAVPFVIEVSSFQGRPAFVAALLQGPASDQPYDRVLMWVLDRSDCRLRYFASIRL